MEETDGHEREERMVFCGQVGHVQATTIVIVEGGVTPSARIVLKHDDTYRNDMPPKFEKLPPLFKLEPYEATLLAETLIAAAEAAKAAIGKRKRDPIIRGG